MRFYIFVHYISVYIYIFVFKLLSMCPSNSVHQFLTSIDLAVVNLSDVAFLLLAYAILS